MYDLRGKVALVTGAGGKRGIGRAIALRLAEEGADVAINDLRPPSDSNTSEWGGLSEVVSEIEAMGRRSLGIFGDVSNAAQVADMVQQVVDTLGHIDILVNNAGTPAGRDRVPVVELAEEDWDRVLRVNAKGTFLCSQAAARAMIERNQGGKIINISSTAGKRGVPRFAAYCSSKFAVIGFTQALAQELAPHRINVNAICPGLTETERVLDMATALAPEGLSPQEHRANMIQDANQRTPLGRVAQAEDIARTATFLASAESDYLTGLAVNVAGGTVMD